MHEDADYDAVDGITESIAKLWINNAEEFMEEAQDGETGQLNDSEIDSSLEEAINQNEESSSEEERHVKWAWETTWKNFL